MLNSRCSIEEEKIEVSKNEMPLKNSTYSYSSVYTEKGISHSDKHELFLEYKMSYDKVLGKNGNPTTLNEYSIPKEIINNRLRTASQYKNFIVKCLVNNVFFDRFDFEADSVEVDNNLFIPKLSLMEEYVNPIFSKKFDKLLFE